MLAEPPPVLPVRPFTATVPAPAPVPLAAAIAAQAQRQPGVTALVWRREAVTYGQLLARADAARAHVEGLGLGPDEPVGLHAPKSPGSVSLVLGCLLAGRRFLLPSAALGPATLEALFAASGCRHVVRPEDVPGAPPPLPVPVLRPAPPAPVEAADVGFMLTTSGSTGLPKVVPLPRGAVDRFVGWAGAHFGLRPGVGVLNHAPLNFDLCLLDVWATLAHGGRVVLVDPDLGVNATHLYGLVRDHRVELVQGVPMLYTLLVDAARSAGRPLDSVRHAVFTGDAIGEQVLRALPGLFPRARLANLYGCTETNDSFLHELAPGELTTPVPIGRPLPGVEAVVLDDCGAPVEGEGAGELYVATPFQAERYLDAARHAGKFVPDPLGRDGRCWFRTGDLVRRRADGALLLDGRADFQVKVRGVAVNTAEVERVLLDHPDVLEAGVAAVEDPLAGKRLACAVQRVPGTRLNTLTLRQHCARHLPQAAIPSIVRIEDRPLPKTPTGKVDRKAVVPSP